jgi:glycerol-3-phosphate O-acyltransferase
MTATAPREIGRARWTVRLGNVVLVLLRRLLYLIVRTRIAPEPIASLRVDRQQPLCYVLQDRHLSSLLVLEQEAPRAGLPPPLAPIGPEFPAIERSVFSVILNPNPLSARTAEPSAALARMAAALRREPALDVQLMPVTILWGRSPDSQDSLVKALFADAWASVGPLRQLLIIIVHGRQTRVSFDAPVSLRRLIGEEADEAAAVRNADRALRLHFRRMREAAIGPDLSHRRNLIDAIVASAALQDEIVDEAKRRGVTTEAAEDRARKFAWEIASDFSYPVIRAGELVLERLWQRLYDGVEIRHGGELVQAAPGNGLVYLPNHRSHIDYLLLSYLVHAQGLAPPHIAAGANLNLPLVGAVLRRGGAFFLRRSFKGEPLYAAVFREYLHAMLAKGFPIAYFIEGGRSRSGRTLAPKGGLLGMTLESFMREHPRPVLMVPVHFSYEKVLEGTTLVAELEGQPKQRESIGALASVARNLRREYGSAYANFGQPLSVGPFLDREAPGWQALNGDAQRETARNLAVRLGREMAQRINAAVVINPINLVAMAIVPSPRHALDERGLAQQIEWLQTIASRLPYSPNAVLTAVEPAAAIAKALKLGFASRVAHPLGDIIAVADRQVSTLNYLRNNVLHAYALPALVANLLIALREATPERVAEFAEGALPFLRAELMLRHSRDEAIAESHRIVALFVEMGLARSSPEGTLRAAVRFSLEHVGLELLARSLRHLLRRNYLTIALMTRAETAKLTRERLEELMQLLTQRLSMLFEFAPPDFYERSTFASYIDTLLETGLIGEDADGSLRLHEHSRTWERYVERLLPPDAVLAIRRVAAGRAPSAATPDAPASDRPDGPAP